MSEKLKSLLFALLFAVFSVIAFVYCFGDATLVLFDTIHIRGFSWMRTCSSSAAAACLSASFF